MIAAELYALRQKYETWADLAADLGFDVRVLGHHKGSAFSRRKPTKRMRRSLARLLDIHYPFPLPGYQNSIRARITKLKKHAGSKDLFEVITEIEGIVGDATPSDAWHAAGLLYLETLARHARAKLNGGQSYYGDRAMLRSFLSRALSAISEAREIIAKALPQAQDERYRRRLVELDVWLFLNWSVIVGDTVDGDIRVSAEELKDVLLSHNALGGFKSAVTNLPHEWRVAYNGLDVACKVAASDQDMDLFYARLLQFDIGFADFGYSPGEVYSIVANPDWEHFRECFCGNPEGFPRSMQILKRTEL